VKPVSIPVHRVSPSAIAAPTPADARESAATVRLAEVVGALSYALDLTEGQRPGHTLRTCVLAMRIGRGIDLSQSELEALYYAALLKDAGCSSNAARMAALFGSDDQSVKRNMRLVDWQDRWRLAARTAENCGVGRSMFARLRHFMMIARTPDMTREIIQTRCERGAAIAAQLGFPSASSEAIAFVDEQWCGLGHPTGMSGVEIPVLSRVLLLAQTLEVFVTEEGIDEAMRMVRARRGRWLDPSIADLVLAWSRADAIWTVLSDSDRLEATVLALEPNESPLFATDERLDAIAQGFASVIDAKSPFTSRHSTNVARYAAAIATARGASPRYAREVLRAGLLHDLGKLGISNRILDKPGALTDLERATMKDHPKWTWEILRHVPAFAGVAGPAAMHHERMDGAGYPWGLGDDVLDETARTLAVADVYEALTANRPYRVGMTAEKALGIMVRDRGTAFDRELYDVAESMAQAGAFAAIAEVVDEPLAAVPGIHLEPLRKMA
jgi:HD-GYP domain-containing protein (c-di-GMP phosphodiesterase class II)